MGSSTDFLPFMWLFSIKTIYFFLQILLEYNLALSFQDHFEREMIGLFWSNSNGSKKAYREILYYTYRTLMAEAGSGYCKTRDFREFRDL